MSGICGWSGFDSTTIDVDFILNKMSATFPSHSYIDSEKDYIDSSALAITSLCGNNRLSKDDQHIIAVEGHPYFSDKKFKQICSETSLARAILEGYKQLGPEILNLLHGAFSIILINYKTGDVLLAIDRIGGRHPLYYHTTKNGIVFASNTHAINIHPDVNTDINPQGIFNYLYFHTVPGKNTIFHEIERLPAGHYALFSKQNFKIVKYWDLQYSNKANGSVEKYSQTLHNLLRKSVKQDINNPDTGCFLSGGTDSSTVTGILQELSEKQTKTYSIGFDAKGFDESYYANIAVKHFNTKQHSYYVTPDDVVELIPRIAETYSEPFGNASAVPTYFCAKLANSNGSKSLLAGDGGDEIFAGNERYVTQLFYELYSSIPDTIKKTLIEPLISLIPDNSSVPPLRKASSYVKQSNISMPKRMQLYNFLERTPHNKVFVDSFLNQVDGTEPLKLLSHVYHDARTDNVLNKMLSLDLPFTLTYNDLPKVSRMCELAGVDVSYPLLSDEMIDFAAQLPPEWKIRRFKLRWFWKHALRDFLPKEILTKKKHGFGLPFGLWMRDHKKLREITYDNISDLKKRNIIQNSYIDELVSKHQSEHASYYGVMLWLLLMLEEWLKIHADHVRF